MSPRRRGRPRHRSLGAVLTALACGAAAVALGGCGAANVIDPVAKAATVSNNSSGFQMLLSMQVSSPVLPTPITATGHGAFDTPDHSGSLSLSMNLGNIPQVTQVLGTSTLQIDEVIKGLTIYMKLPAALTGKVPSLAGKPWLKIDLAHAASAAGIPGLSSLASNPASTNPGQFLRYLRAESGGVTKVGSESVDGIQTTHYRAQIQLDRVPNVFPPASRPSARQSVAALERITHLHQLPVDVWVDGQHLVRRMRFSLGQSVSGQALTTTLTLDIPQYGPQPPPALPPANQVRDLTGLTGGALGGSSTASG